MLNDCLPGPGVSPGGHACAAGEASKMGGYQTTFWVLEPVLTLSGMDHDLHDNYAKCKVRVWLPDSPDAAP